MLARIAQQILRSLAFVFFLIYLQHVNAWRKFEEPLEELEPNAVRKPRFCGCSPHSDGQILVACTRNF